jgi:ABC-type sugar transport system substrate-binding protein
MTAPKKLRFLLSLITRDNDYQREQAAAATEAAERLGLELDVQFAGNDSIQQSTQLLNTIQATGTPLDAILVEPASRTGFPRIAEAAVAAGSAWVILNSEAEYLKALRSNSKLPAFCVSVDNLEIGRIQGRQLATLLPGGGCAIYLQGPSGSSVVEQRTAGMLETKPPTVTIKMLKSADWTEEGGNHAVSSWLRLSTAKNDRIDALQAQNDFLAMGARKALNHQIDFRDRGMGSRLPLLGVDGLERTGRSWVRQGHLTATVVVPPTAGRGLEIAVAVLQKGCQPAERTLVTPQAFPELLASASRQGN